MPTLRAILFQCKSGVSFKQACHSSNINIVNSSLVLARIGSVSDTIHFYVCEPEMLRLTGPLM